MKINKKLLDSLPSEFRNMGVSFKGDLPKEGQRSKEWHKIREGRFTASTISKIICKGSLTVGAKNYIAKKLWLDYYFEKPEQEEPLNNIYSGVYAIDRGIDLEPEALDFYMKNTGIEMIESDFVKYGDFSGGSPDGKHVVDGGIKGICEIKCPEGYIHLNWGMLQNQSDLKSKDKQYFYQNMSNLLFTGAEWCDFISYHNKCKISKMFILRMLPDKEEFEIIKKAIKAATDFRNTIISTLEKKKKYL